MQSGLYAWAWVIKWFEVGHDLLCDITFWLNGSILLESCDVKDEKNPGSKWLFRTFPQFHQLFLVSGPTYSKNIYS